MSGWHCPKWLFKLCRPMFDVLALCEQQIGKWPMLFTPEKSRNLAQTTQTKYLFAAALRSFLLFFFLLHTYLD
jgi:hypothetical protein